MVTIAKLQLYRPTELLTIADQKAKYPVSIAIQISGTEVPDVVSFFSMFEALLKGKGVESFGCLEQFL